MIRHCGMVSILSGLAVWGLSCRGPSSPSAGPSEPTVVRVGVWGGISKNGQWDKISEMFEAQSRYKVEVAAAGRPSMLFAALKEGKLDLLTTRLDDETNSLAQQGYVVDMRPWTWTNNDFVIVGPVADPAKIRGLHDGAEAFKRIAKAGANFVELHGEQDAALCRRLWSKAGTEPRGDRLLKEPAEGHLETLTFAAQHLAYVVLGRRVPVTVGRDEMEKLGVAILVEDDPAMQEPYVVMEANPTRFPKTNAAGARALAAFLLSDPVQQFLGRSSSEWGTYPLFRPIRGTSPPDKAKRVQ